MNFTKKMTNIQDYKDALRIQSTTISILEFQLKNAERELQAARAVIDCVEIFQNDVRWYMPPELEKVLSAWREVKGK